VYDQIADEDLMLQYGDGDAGAFAALYHRHKGAVYRYFLRQTNHAPAAEELSQDVWTNVIRRRESYRVSAKFTTYLFQIAHNRLVDHLRRRVNQPAINEPLDDCDAVAKTNSNPDKRAEAAQISNQLLRVLNELPAEQRDAFLLKEEAGLSVIDIAAVTSVNAETVKSRLRYAQAKLREGLRALYE
jgi:RNA polymerase sigma-70 factor (ECF subfamily)